MQSIEPLIGKSTANIPRDPLRSIPPVPAFSQPASPEPVTPVPVAPEQPAAATPVKKRFMPRLFSPKDLPPTPLVPASMPTSAPPRPKKPVNKKKIVLAIGIIVIILLAVVAAVVILPKMGSLGNLLHSSNGSSSATTTTAGTTTSSAGNSSAIVVATQTPVSIPQTGVDVYVNYIGGWKGTYGTSDNQLTETNSGERILPVENATGADPTGTVTASFWKQDRSSHAITVSIYKNGKVLSSSSTTAAFGKVTLSVNVTTGVAQRAGGQRGSSRQPCNNGTGRQTTAKTTTVNTTTAAAK